VSPASVSATTRKSMLTVTWSPKRSASARSRATSSNHCYRTVPARYSGTVSWLATGSRDHRRFNEDQWPVANASSVGNAAASHRLHYCADGEMHLPEVLGWTATEGMGPWC
jgi:hypothetical protein